MRVRTIGSAWRAVGLYVFLIPGFGFPIFQVAVHSNHEFGKYDAAITGILLLAGFILVRPPGFDAKFKLVITKLPFFKFSEIDADHAIPTDQKTVDK